MKKIMTIAAAALCASVFADGITSANVVGYQNKGFENSGFSIAVNTFQPVGIEQTKMTLGDIKVNDDFATSKIVFMTSGGATAKTTFGGKTVSKEYVYWRTSDDPEQGEGWYLSKDGDGEINQNSVSLPMGSRYLVSRMGSETDASLIFSGEVSSVPVTKGFESSGFSLVGNCSPVSITLGDITPNDAFVSSKIVFMTTGGATAKTTFNGKTVSQEYVYWRDTDDPEEGAGWYLSKDGDGEKCFNSLSVAPGAGFMVSRMGSETKAMLTIPSAL